MTILATQPPMPARTKKKKWDAAKFFQYAALKGFRKSRLNCELLEFKPYNYEETLGILKQRIEYAFHPNVFNKEAMELIAKKTFERAI